MYPRGHGERWLAGVNSYIGNFEQWKKIITDTIQIVTRTEERLDSASFREDLDAWLTDRESVQPDL